MTTGMSPVSSLCVHVALIQMLPPSQLVHPHNNPLRQVPPLLPPHEGGNRDTDQVPRARPHRQERRRRQSVINLGAARTPGTVTWGSEPLFPVTLPTILQENKNFQVSFKNLTDSPFLENNKKNEVKILHSKFKLVLKTWIKHTLVLPRSRVPTQGLLVCPLNRCFWSPTVLWAWHCSQW